MADVKIFIAGFEDRHAKYVPPHRALQYVNLSHLPIGALNRTELSEHRLYLSALADAPRQDYTGLLTWRWYDKCRLLIPFDRIAELPMAPNVVWCAWYAEHWFAQSCRDHPGIDHYLREAADYTGLSLQGHGLWANQLICSREVFQAFIAWFRPVFAHFHAKYGYTGYHFRLSDHYRSRLPSIFYERLTTMYCANRHDLILAQIPKK